MAALDIQEQEQVDALKHWWNDNSRWLVGALLVAAVGMAGWRGWNYYQSKQSAEAGALYAQMELVAPTDAKRLEEMAAIVVDKYSSSAYAPRAALMAAEADLEAQDQAKASSRLQWVVDHAKEEGLQNLARLKLAGLLLDQKKYAEALQQLEAKHPDSFDGLYADLKGDVLSAKGDTAAARSAYKLAYDKSPADGMQHRLIEMKLDALGGAQ